MTTPARGLVLDRGGLDLAASGPSFARGLWRIAAADVSSGNRVHLLRDGPATFDAMLELIDNATTCVALESYIFRSDEVGHRFAGALTRAASRGVEVRLLLDWVGIRGTSRKFIRSLERPDELARRAAYPDPVEEKANFHAARRRPGERTGESMADLVRAEDVALERDAGRRVVDE